MVLLTLRDEVDFDARDGVGVNLFCIVLSPESERMVHLRLVSRVMRLLKNEDVRAGLAAAKSEHDMRSVLVESERFMVAA
jgi:PTS system nitrogen regulatory IIA component